MLSSDSTLRTIAFDSSARHGTETICSGGPALTKIDEDDRDDSWVFVLPKPKKPFPGKVSRVSKGANETLGTATVRAIPCVRVTLIIWRVSPTTFMLQLGSQSLESLAVESFM